MGDQPDVLIVGGGAAGCVMARRLADQGRSVVLLEAGADIRGRVTPALRDGWNLPSGGNWTWDGGLESEPGPSGTGTKLRRGRLLGGTSWLTRFAVRGGRADFASWESAAPDVWSWPAMLEAFRRLETDNDLGHEPWHGDTGPMPVNRYPELPRAPIHLAWQEALSDLGFDRVVDHNAPDAVGVGPMPMSTRGGDRVTTLDGYLPDGAVPANLAVRTDALVDRVLLDHGRAIGVRLATGEEVGAQEVLLCAGTYGSPVMLMRSGIGPAAHLREVGISPLVDLLGVGENLADHSALDLDSGWRGDAPSGGPVLHSIATFRSSERSPSAAPDLLFWATDPSGDDARFYLDPILMKPEARGRVRLRSADPSSPPRIDIPDPRIDADITRLQQGYRLALEVAEHPAVRALRADAPPPLPVTSGEWRTRIDESLYSLPHVVGTCRMGSAPEDGSVVDWSGRVHGVDGLRVIDASILPEPTAGFPHVVTIMAAERLAERWPS